MNKFVANHRVFLLGGIPFLAMALYFYPAMWTYMDENIYIALANVLRHGTIYADQAGVQVPFMASYASHQLPQYPLGMPSLIALFSFAGWRSIFLINILFLFVGFFYFIRWLRLEAIPESYALLYLLYPSFVFYSRTLMTEVTCAAIVTIALYKFRTKRYFLSALILGLGFSVKNILVLVMVPMFFATLLEWYRIGRNKDRSNAGPFLFCAGAIPGVFLVLLYNLISTGNLFTFAYSVHKGQPLSFIHIFENLLLYGQSLSLIYPLFFVPVLIAVWRREKLVLCAIAILFTSFYLLIPSNWILNNQRPDLLQRLVLQPRYLMPVIPVFLFLYVWELHRIASRIKFPVQQALSFGCVLLFILLGILSQRHQRYLTALADLQREVYQNTESGFLLIANYDSTRLLNDIIAPRSWRMEQENTEKPEQNSDLFFVELVRSSPAVESSPSDNPGVVVRKVQNQVGALTIYRSGGI